MEPVSRRRLIRRLLIVSRQLSGLLAGGLIAYLHHLPPEQQRRHWLLNTLAGMAQRRLDPALVDLPFAAQLRRRLEQLGPTYIKLGQIMAVR